MGRPPGSGVLSIEARLDRLTYYEPNTGCWLWLGYLNDLGYGRFNNTTSHKATYELERGPVPDGMELDHICRVRACRSPYHLEPVTHQVNVLRGQSPNVVAHINGTCTKGHPWAPPNLYHDRHGKAFCRQCRDERWARWIATHTR